MVTSVEMRFRSCPHARHEESRTPAVNLEGGGPVKATRERVLIPFVISSLVLVLCCGCSDIPGRYGREAATSGLTGDL